jgi:hypothetical protein
MPIPAWRQASVAILAYLFMSAASADMIDFEVVPGETAADAIAISTQYLATHGVSFINSDGSTPHLERRGGQDFNAGFKNFGIGGSPDIEALTHTGEFGTFFLRINTENISAGPVPDILINYAVPVAAASGQIWDIDGTGFITETEQWRVTAYDDLGNTLTTIDSPLGDSMGPESLDGLPWTWSFDESSASIYQIRMAFTGSKVKNISMAFDNFKHSEATVVPMLVGVDVLPGDSANEIFPNKGGQLPVAILGSNAFDATQVDPVTLKFGIGEAEPIAPPVISDVDGISGLETTVIFSVEEIGIACNDTAVSLSGATYAGEDFIGMDTIDATQCQSGGCHVY